MLNLDLTDRLAYDPERNILFLNFEGCMSAGPRTSTAIRDAVASAVPADRPAGGRGRELRRFPARPGGRRTPTPTWCARWRTPSTRRVSRYTTSAFMRVKLGQVLTRTVRPHIFESKAEAQAFHEKLLST